MSPRANETRNSVGGKNDKTEALLFRAHHEKSGFTRKDNNAGENRRQQGKKIKYEMDGSRKEATGMSPQELIRAGEDRTLRTSLIHRVTRKQANSTACRMQIRYNFSKCA